jgi:hypothetical protein
MEEAHMLGTFIRLVDTLLVEGLAALTLGTALDLHALLETPCLSGDKQSKV